MRALIELEEGDPAFRWLRNAKYLKSYILDGFMVVVFEAGSLGSNIRLGKLSKALGEKFGKKVRVVEKGGDQKIIAGQLLYPARVMGVNTLWLPDGSTRYTVRISRGDLRHLPASIEILEKVLTQIFGRQTVIRYD